MLPMLSLDKANHVVYGSAAGCLSAGAAAIVGLDSIGIALTAAVISGLVGYAKEAYDKAHGGTQDWKDAVATFAGGLLVSAPFVVRGLL